jgi:hypothetical protein
MENISATFTASSINNNQEHFEQSTIDHSDANIGKNVIIRFTDLVQDQDGKIYAVGTHGCIGPSGVAGIP